MEQLIEADAETDPEKQVFGYAARWSVNQAIERVCKRTKLKYYSSYKLGRHIFVARLLESGGSLKEAQAAGRRSKSLLTARGIWRNRPFSEPFSAKLQISRAASR